MVEWENKMTIGRDQLLAVVLELLKDITGDWEMAFESSIGPETLLGADLGMRSIEVVKLIEAVQTKYNRVDFPFEDLFMPGGATYSRLKHHRCCKFFK